LHRRVVFGLFDRIQQASLRRPNFIEQFRPDGGMFAGPDRPNLGQYLVRGTRDRLRISFANRQAEQAIVVQRRTLVAEAKPVSIRIKRCGSQAAISKSMGYANYLRFRAPVGGG
jgi:hypothetical protein